MRPRGLAPLWCSFLQDFAPHRALSRPFAHCRGSASNWKLPIRPIGFGRVGARFPLDFAPRRTSSHPAAPHRAPLRMFFRLELACATARLCAASALIPTGFRTPSHLFAPSRTPSRLIAPRRGSSSNWKPPKRLSGSGRVGARFPQDFAPRFPPPRPIGPICGRSSNWKPPMKRLGFRRVVLRFPQGFAPHRTQLGPGADVLPSGIRLCGRAFLRRVGAHSYRISLPVAPLRTRSHPIAPYRAPSRKFC